MLLPVLPKACIWEYFWVAHSLFSFISASVCQHMLLKQTSYFKRRFLLSVLVSLAMSWEGGKNSKRRKVNSGLTKKTPENNVMINQYTYPSSIPSLRVIPFLDSSEVG